ncbi:hypothetical protein ACHAPT_006637 [Fusarium lateritium]
MSQRIWHQVEKTFEALALGKKRPEDDDSTDTDRTRNELVNGQYEYAPLAGGPNSIRLLELLPGTRQDDIVRNYEALSYVWGDTTELTPIQINGCTLMITTNLRTALLNIRNLDQPRTLWVDAVCIDQTNVLERNHQVSIMGDIYRNSARTIVWMGDNQPPYTADAFAMIDELAAEAISRQHTSLSIDAYNLPLTFVSLESIESPLFDRFRDDFSVLHLASAEWWFRAWTVQEILLASRAVAMTGTFTMDWDRFSTGINYGLTLGIWNPVLLGTIVDPVVVPYLSTHALREQRRARQRPGHAPTTPAQVLLELLIQCRFRQASDPRDKVYALLGLKDEDADSLADSLGIEPDYRLSTTQVYCHTARQLLLQSGELNILGACTATTNQELPSWVPDWSNMASGPRPLMHDARGRLRQTHASRGTETALSFLDDGRILVLVGHEFMTVTHLSPALQRLRRNSNDFAPIKRGDTLLSRLASLGQLFVILMALYWELSSVIPHLATFWDWETFARESSASSQNQDISSNDPDSPYDPLAVYWQTLSVGTFASGGRHATAQLFYSWRSSLRPIFNLRRWRVDSLLRPLAFLGYLMRTWRDYSEFASLLEPVYERRLGRGENGFLALLPGEAEVVKNDEEMSYLNRLDALQPPANMNCPEIFSLAKSWVDDCLTNHPQCRSILENAWHPTRLLDSGPLDASGKPAIKLVETKATAVTGPYMTLSHSWGKGHSVKLNKGTYQRFLNGVDPSSLPTLFRETSFVARQLGVRYVWIDALYIFQDKDDLSDWNREAALMHLVYANSLCNIVAAETVDSSHSMFSSRDPTTMFPPLTTIALHRHEEEFPKKFSFRDRDFSKRIDKAPVNTRAWVMQERYMSPRALHWGAQQLFWECREKVASELDPDGRAISHWEFLKSKFVGTRDLLPNQRDKYPFQSQEDIDFRHLVENYSRCVLTFPSDKLIAFSAIMKQICTVWHQEPVVGMRRSCLEADLLWSVSLETQSSQYETYVAPSWSWASVKGKVSYGLGPVDRDLIRVEDYKLEYVTEDPTGAVQEGGWLRLSGLLRRVKLLRRDDDDDEDSGRGNWSLVVNGVEPKPSNPWEVYLDAPSDHFDDENESGALYCMPSVIQDHPDGTIEVQVLLFKLVDAGEAIFRRIGAAWAFDVGHSFISKDDERELEARRQKMARNLPGIKYKDGHHSIRII